MAAVKGEKTPAELAAQFGVHPNQITQRRGQLLEGAAGVFGNEARREAAEPVIDVKTCTPRLASGRSARDGRTVAERKTMIDRAHALPLAQQAQALGIRRGSIYYLPKPVSAADLAIMRRMDELHLEFPFAGSRMGRDLLRQEGVEIGRQHVAALMKKMAIEAIYRRVSEARVSIGRYLNFCNGRRPHSSLAARTPDLAYFDNLPARMAA